ncbi:mitotic-spindle organizing protein 2A [Trichonephila clavipes]|nr:mitotic-spindle organizing protein 2A [Trichonephila clavipes]
MACERKFLESEATTGFFLLLGQQGNKAVLDWVMKEGLIPSRYECPKCKKDMRLVERKGTIDGFEWRCRVQSKENPHFVCRSVRKGTWFSDSRLSICVILRLTRYWFGKSMNEGYRHLTVNHSLTFKDPETGAHTNAIEGTWSAIKRNLKGHTAHVEGQFDSYLAEYMWRRSNEHKMIDANFKDYLQAIARVYPPHESDDQKK